MANISYEKEFKEKLVKLHLEEGRTPSSLAKEYNISRSTIASWIKTYSKECEDSNEMNSNISPKMYDELKMLRKKVHELEKENSFLKKTAAFFAKEIDK